MKTFDEIYNEIQESNKDELNDVWTNAKKQKNKMNNISKIICFVIDIVLVIIFFQQTINEFSIIMTIFEIVFINLFVTIIIGIFSYTSKEYKELNDKYKDLVIKKLINNFYDNVEYFPNKEMPEYIYENLDYEYYNIYRSSDYFEAQIKNKYSIQMGEVFTQEEQEYTDSDGEKETITITKFHGLFAKILIDKSINSELKIMQNGAFFLNNRLKMDSSEFEKYFDVKASNQIIGMQLLTADVMEQLVEFENKTKMKFDIIIKENELFLRFHSGDMFEVDNAKKDVLDKSIIQKYFYMLNFTYNLSNSIINLVNDTQI